MSYYQYICARHLILRLLLGDWTCNKFMAWFCGETIWKLGKQILPACFPNVLWCWYILHALFRCSEPLALLFFADLEKSLQSFFFPVNIILPVLLSVASYSDKYACAAFAEWAGVNHLRTAAVSVSVTVLTALMSALSSKTCLI